MKRRKCRYVDQRDIEACIDQLQAIIDGLRSGSMALEEEEQSLLLRPGGLLDFELRVEQLERKETLRVEMSWKLQQRRAEAGGAPASGERPVLDDSLLDDAAVWDGPITAWPRSERTGSVVVEDATLLAEEALAEEALAEEAGRAEAPRTQPSATAALTESLAAAALATDVLAADSLAGDSLAIEGHAPDSRLERSLECNCAARSVEDPISGWPPPRPVVAEYHQLYADACTMGSDGQWHIDRDQLVQSLARAGVDPLTQQDLYSFALQADLDRTSWFSERVIAALERASQRPVAAVG